MDKILDKGLQQRIERAKQHQDEENREIIIAKANLAKLFAQQQAFEFARENYSGVMAEVKRMQDDKGYKSTWTPKTLEAMSHPPQSNMSPEGGGMVYTSPAMRM